MIHLKKALLKQFANQAGDGEKPKYTA